MERMSKVPQKVCVGAKKMCTYVCARARVCSCTRTERQRAGERVRQTDGRTDKQAIDI